jgi:predicted lipoprotein with Yx(FWY)xxD motif
VTRHALAVLVLAASIAGCGGSGRTATTQDVIAAAPAQTAETPKPHADAPIAVRVIPTAYGRALADRRGFALHAFTHDRSRNSTCYGACAAAWPPYLVRARAAPGSGVRSRLVGTTRRRDGRPQVTYAGHPLYYYVGDREPGQVLCQAVTEFGGTWLVVAPDGRLVR